MDSSDTNSVISVLIAGAILLTICIVLGLIKLCCRSSHPSDPRAKLAYPVAISNRLFNVKFSRPSILGGLVKYFLTNVGVVCWTFLLSSWMQS